MAVSNVENMLNRYYATHQPTGEAADLAGQIGRTGQRIMSYGGVPPQEKPPGRSIFERGMSIVGRGFDILSRGQYAVAEAVESAIEGESPLGVIGGAISGVAGRSKTSFSDVLETAGVDNKWVKGIGGFALDVALDPTTYIGAGVVKNLSEEALATAGGKAIKELGTTASGRLSYLAASNDAKAAAKQIAQQTGEVITKEEYRAIAKQGAEDLAVDVAMNAQDTLRYAAKNRGKVQLKFAGKKIAESKKIYNAGVSAGEWAKKYEIIDNLNRKFRTEATVRGRTAAGVPIKSAKRQFEGENIYKLEKDIREQVKPMFQGLSKQEKRRISHAIEDGVDFGTELSKNGKSLQQAKDAAIKYLQGLRDWEIEFGLDTGKGLLNADETIENYLYHSLRSGTRKDRVEWKRLRRKEAAKVKGPSQVNLTLREAARRGLNPVEEIDEIIAKRLSKSYHLQAKYRWSRFLRDEFGLIGLKEGAANRIGLIKADNAYIGNASSFIPGNIYIPHEINETLKRVDQFFLNEDESNSFLRMFDKVQNYWKMSATVVNPGHHIRNLIGDTFLNFLDGVKNPRVYEQSIRANGLLDKVGMGLEKIKVGEIDVSLEELQNFYTGKGAKAGFFRTEFSSEQGGITNRIRNFAEKREDITRMAHFIDAFKKEGKNIKKGTNEWTELHEAATKAAARVRKYNIDYGDLTRFEQRYMKRVIPFYTFMRKNIPLQFEAMFMNPGRQAALPKALHGLEEVLGIEGEGETLEGLGTLPIWMRQAMSVNILGEGMGRNGVYWDPSVIPAFDIGTLLETGQEGGVKGVVSNILSKTSPILRAPLEISTGKEIFTGRDISDVGALEYFMNQTAATRMARQNLMGSLLSEDEKLRASEKGKGQNPIMSFLLKAGPAFTGLSLSELTEQRQKAELRRQQDPYDITLQKLRSEARQRALQRLYGNNIPPGLIQ